MKKGPIANIKQGSKTTHNVTLVKYSCTKLSSNHELFQKIIRGKLVGEIEHHFVM